MSIFHDEVEIEDFDWDEATQTYYYPCPCGDRFQITKAELASGEDIARCPSCSLIVRVIYDPEGWRTFRRVTRVGGYNQEDFAETEEMVLPVEVPA